MTTDLNPWVENSQWLFEDAVLGRYAQLRSNFVLSAKGRSPLTLTIDKDKEN